MITDLEVSTYQKRPCYRYIRRSDKMPPHYDSTNNTTVRVKLFNPTGIGTWYLTEYDPDTRTAYGLCVLQDAELGYVNMAELTSFRGQFGLPIERDLHWTPKPLSEVTAKELT